MIVPGRVHGCRRAVARLAVVGLVALALNSTAAPAGARVATRSAAASNVSFRPGSMATFEDDPHTVQSLVPARSIAPSSTRLSSVHTTFVVTYHGFPDNAKAAFQRAVDLWSLLVKSSQPIRIDATWTPLPTGQLGGAGPVDDVRNFPGAPFVNTWYPVALANALAGQDLSPDPDISAEFNSAKTTWYFGTDGVTPSGVTDFETVVLHEIGHGLGLIGSVGDSGTQATVGVEGSAFPYDDYAQSAAGTPLVNVAQGTVLGSVVQSDGVRWGGAQGIAGAGGSRPYLYSPNPWLQGSSIYHLDENVYPPGNPDSLMTPYLDRGEAIHDPGDIVLGMLRDMGWGTTGPKGIAAAPTLTEAVGGDHRVILDWHQPIDTGRQVVTATRVYRYANGSSSPSATFDVPWPTGTFTDTGLTDGTPYRWGVADVNASGAGLRSALSEVIRPTSLAPFTRSDTFVKQQFADFLGRQPNAGELAYWLTAIHSWVVTPGGAVNGIAHLGESSDPSGRTTRLYSAYFQRLPDIGGYNFWLTKLRTGTSLTQASNTFVASSEFVHTYGSLSNSAFIQLVYHNVLHRTADSGGLNYWLTRLNAHSVTRGGVMLAFSESSENVRTMTPKVDSVLIRTSMLRAMPTPTEYAADVAAFGGGESFTQLATSFLALPAYISRFPA